MMKALREISDEEYLNASEEEREAMRYEIMAAHRALGERGIPTLQTQIDSSALDDFTNEGVDPDMPTRLMALGRIKSRVGLNRRQVLAGNARAIARRIVRSRKLLRQK